MSTTIDMKFRVGLGFISYSELAGIDLTLEHTRGLLQRLGVDIDSQQPQHGVHDKWTLGNDPSIKAPKNYVGMELMSPVLPFGERDPELKVIHALEALGQCGATVNQTCSTRVHISFADNEEIPMERAEMISIAAWYFERSVESLLPDHCWDYLERKSNRSNINLYELNAVEAWKAIRMCNDIRSLARLMCPVENGHGEDGDHIDPKYRVNLKGLDFKTIEFRYLPGCRASWEVQDWINFVGWFVRASLSVDREALNNDAIPYFNLRLPPSDASDFKRFIGTHAVQGGIHDFWWRLEMYKRDWQENSPNEAVSSPGRRIFVPF
ncbi:hypothetical protein F5B20DRAFT_272673 [Whalleya microplaca]|nr:hypothetical protein F5B20DRAFT_272673 [Whalleya microplaca]